MYARAMLHGQRSCVLVVTGNNKELRTEEKLKALVQKSLSGTC